MDRDQVREWYPADEAEAVSTIAVFTEWLRASGRMPDASPAAVRRWYVQDPAGFAATVVDFAKPLATPD